MTQGRKTLPLKERKAIRDRLREHLEASGKSQTKLFEKELGFPSSTVAGWFNKEDPTIPEVASCVELAKQENLSLNWLLLGEGPELQGATVPFDDVAKDLRATIAAELKTARIGTRQEVEWVPDRLLPDADALLRKIVHRYIDDSEEWIGAMRRALGRAISHQDATKS